jgi:hypothetical protein
MYTTSVLMFYAYMKMTLSIMDCKNGRKIDKECIEKL